MKDRVLIDLLIACTLPKIRELTVAMHRHATSERGTLDSIVSVITGRTVPPEPLDDVSQRVVDGLWKAPLTDISVHLLRAVAHDAVDGEFVATRGAVAKAWASVTPEFLQPKTGIHADDIRLVKPAMGEAFLEVVDQHAPIDVSINRKQIRINRAEGAMHPRPD